jgi:hypothetical protein
MLFDNFDKKIKEAAEQHHPAYDENAWRKMENLLDQHLPRQNDRRRFFLLAFVVFLIGGGAFFLLSKPRVKNSDVAVQQNNNSTNNKPQAGKSDKNPTVVLPGIDNPDKEITADNLAPVTKTRILDKNGNTLGVTDEKKNFRPRSEEKVNGHELVINNNTIVDRNRDISVSQSENKGDEIVTAPVTTPADQNVAKNETVANNPVTKPTVVENTQQLQPSSATKTTPKKGRSGGMNGLSFYVSAGPDISKAENSKAGKVTMSWGLGVAYTLKRFTLRTGVFSANKIYWAGPDDYKLSYTPPSSLKFMGADANCRVIEVPVKLSYDFAVKNRSNWFVGAGLSSYLMKREDYLYEYKSNTGNSYYHSYETKNENKHYFSVLNLSGGYSYRLSNTVSLSAEPYLEVPLTGIGAGKVHLNSGGILFTVGVSPFRK